MNSLFQSNTNLNSNIGNSYTNTSFGNYNTNYGYGTGHSVGNTLQGFYSSIFEHKYLVSSIILMIPIITFIAIGFAKKNNKLGWTGIALLLSVLLLIGTMAFRTGKPQHYILLVALIIIELGFIIYFLTTLRRKVSSSMYLDFYNPSSYSKDSPIPLSYYGLGGDNDTLLKLMKGTEYAFALKEDMPIDLGAEGTYSFWLRVCPVNFNKENKNWRTVWYRGNPNTGSIYQQKTPGVYLAPNTNKMIITVACENGPDEGNAITLDDIPLNTWFCTTIVLNGRSLDVYVNGLLERSISLTGMPLMTNSNLLKGRNGFDGLMAFFRYSSAAEEPHHIRNIYERERITLEGSEYPLNCE